MSFVPRSPAVQAKTEKEEDEEKEKDSLNKTFKVEKEEKPAVSPLAKLLMEKKLTSGGSSTTTKNEERDILKKKKNEVKANEEQVPTTTTTTIASVAGSTPMTRGLLSEAKAEAIAAPERLLDTLQDQRTKNHAVQFQLDSCARMIQANFPELKREGVGSSIEASVESVIKHAFNLSREKEQLLQQRLHVLKEREEFDKLSNEVRELCARVKAFELENADLVDQMKESKARSASVQQENSRLRDELEDLQKKMLSTAAPAKQSMTAVATKTKKECFLCGELMENTSKAIGKHAIEDHEMSDENDFLVREEKNRIKNQW